MLQEGDPLLDRDSLLLEHVVLVKLEELRYMGKNRIPVKAIKATRAN